MPRGRLRPALPFAAALLLWAPGAQAQESVRYPGSCPGPCLDVLYGEPKCVLGAGAGAGAGIGPQEELALCEATDCTSCFARVGRCMDPSQAGRAGLEFGDGCPLEFPEGGAETPSQRLAKAIATARRESPEAAAQGEVADADADASQFCGGGGEQGGRPACVATYNECVGYTAGTGSAGASGGGEEILASVSSRRHCLEGMEIARRACAEREDGALAEDDCEAEVQACLDDMAFSPDTGYALHGPTDVLLGQGWAEAISVCGACAGLEPEGFRDCIADSGRERPDLERTAGEAKGDEGSSLWEVFRNESNKRLAPAVDEIAKGGAVALGALGRVFDDPESCFVCGVVYLVATLAPQLGEQGFRLLTGPTLTLLAVLFPLWLTLQFARGATAVDGSGSSAWPSAFGGVSRLLVVLVLVGGFAWQSRGDPLAEGDPGTYRQLMGGIVAPALELSAATGMALMFSAGAGAAGFLDEVEEESEATIQRLRSSSPVKDPLFDGVSAGVMRFVQAAHVVGRAGYARALGFLNDAVAHEAVSAKIVSGLLGGLLCFLFTAFLVTSGIRLVDPLLRIVAVTALSPLIAAAWIFPSTRHATHAGLRALAYAALSLVVAGLLFGLALHILMGTMMVSVGVSPTDALTYDELMARLRRDDVTLAAGADAAGFDVDYVGAIISVIAVLVAHGIISQVQAIAGQIADFSAQGGVGEQVEGQARGLAGQATGVVVSSGVGAVRMGAGGVRGILGLITR